MIAEPFRFRWGRLNRALETLRGELNRQQLRPGVGVKLEPSEASTLIAVDEAYVLSLVQASVDAAVAAHGGGA